EAKTEREELIAEQSFLNSKKSYRNSLLKFYQDIVTLYYSAIDQMLDLKIKENSLKLAEMDLNDKKTLHERGIITYEELEDASISYEKAKLDLKKTNFEYEKTLEDLKWRTSISADVFSTSTLILSPDELPSSRTFLESDLDVKIKEIALEVAKLNLEMAESSYDTEKAERELKNARRQLDIARRNSMKNYEEKVFNLKYLYENLLIARRAYELERKNLENARKKYEKGIISEKEYMISLNQLLSKERALFQAEKSYMLSLIDFLINSGLEDPFMKMRR
ncbi:MAG: TolC family protein, partial [Thermotogaceae bacterium]|nr:TolC family protein [Thermotogaceae bacterium]